MDKFEKTNRGTALIIGAGAMGSLFAALLLSEGWDRVIVADRDPGGSPTSCRQVLCRSMYRGQPLRKD